MTPRGERQAPPTSAQVARRAGVSRPTVSQILNGRAHLFADETVARVLKAAEALNYRPSVVGRALVSGRSDIVVLAVPYVTLNELFQQVVDLLTDRLADEGLLLVTQYVHQNIDSLRSLVDQLRPAIVLDIGALSPTERDAFEADGFPVVSGNEGDTVGARQVEHLVARGAKRIDYALRADHRNDVMGPGRAAAVSGACESWGLPEPRSITVPAGVAEARAVLEAHLAHHPRPDAIACYNDDVGAVLVAAASGLGLRIPEDLAIIGVDDSPSGRVCVPPLTTVAIDVRAAIDRMFAGAMHRLNRASADSPPFVGLPSDATRIVERAST